MTAVYAWTRYLEADGNITGHGSMPAAFAAVQPRGAGERIYTGAALSPASHYFLDGQPVRYTTDQAAAKAARPAHATRWCNATMRWLDERSGEQRAADELADVHLARRLAYPPVGDQLDCLWKAMRDGALPKVEPFFSDIAAVKAAHPKPKQ